MTKPLALVAALLFIVLGNTLAQAGAPVALAPEGPVAAADPEFSWTPVAGADSYRLHVRNAANQPVFNRWYSAEEAGCADGVTTCGIQTSMDFPPLSFRFRVLPRSSNDGLGSWSRWLVFYPGRDEQPPPPPPPSPATPKGEADSRYPWFTWAPVPDTSRYRLQVRDAAGTLVLESRWRHADSVGCSDGVSTCSFRPPAALASGEYRWKLLGRNNLLGALSGWSKYTYFTVPEADGLGSGLDARPENPTCRLPQPPPKPSGVAAQEVFQDVPFAKQVILVASPTDERWFSVAKDGLVTAFDASDPAASTVAEYLDIRDRVLDDTGETGLLGMAFHPDYPAANRVFLFYTNMVGGEYVSYLSEFQSLDSGLSLSPATEKNILTLTGHATHNHKAGTIGFGRDGYLYLSLGDGGTRVEAQNTYSLFGSIIRIDVDSAEPYAIPPDNPFADGVEGAPEVFAWGLRNPWRWSFDPHSDLLWVTDVGHQSWEEVNIAAGGENFGWPILEGPECFKPAIGCDTEGLEFPVHAYPHDATGGFVVVGGFVYRGSALPQWRDNFIFADGTDRVWALVFDQDGNSERVILIDGGVGDGIIRSMFMDDKGELYLVKGRQVFQLVPEYSDGQADFPEILSATGCTDTEDPTVMVDAMIPYEVNSQFWTDGAAKSRWMALPDGKTIGFLEDGDFDYPVGTVLAKEFRLGGQRVETRLFTRHDDGNWAGYSYAWDNEQNEAFLVGPYGAQLDVDGQPYTIPGRNECLSCHSQAAGRALGPEIQQLNGTISYPSTGRNANQLTTLEVIGLFDEPLADRPENLPALPAIGDATASFDERARAYLHSNCSSCHRPDGGGRGPADLRFQPLEFMQVCDIAPETGDLDIENARLLAPGDPERSIISARMQSLGPEAMPPIGKNRVDIFASAVVDEYIADLENCPPAPALQRHADLHPD